jgi:hypothetical protein
MCAVSFNRFKFLIPIGGFRGGLARQLLLPNVPHGNRLHTPSKQSVSVETIPTPRSDPLHDPESSS